MRHMIPALGEEPELELVNFLHKNQLEWSGDDSGVILHMSDGSIQMASPGDYIFRNDDNVYSVEKAVKE